MIFTYTFARFLQLACLMCITISLVWPQWTEAIPVAFNGELEYKQSCGHRLSEAIDVLCNGRTRSLMDNYPHSIGQRTKRVPQEFFYSPLKNGPAHDCCLRPCSYPQLREYCAPDVTDSQSK